MAGDRMVTVRLIGEVGQFRAAMAAAAASVRQVDAAVNATNSNVLRSTNRMAAGQRAAMTGMVGGMQQVRGMITGLGIPLAIGAAAKAFFDFEQQMAKVKAVADSYGRSDFGMKRLHDAALSAGQQYGFTATQVGQAQEELLKAGRSTAQVLGGELTASLTLAAAGTIGLDEAAKITASTMTIFKDDQLNAVQVADKYVQAANATTTSVSELGTAMTYVGPVANALGISMDDTVDSLALFAQAGIDGDRAGTGMRGMLTNLLSPSAMARKEMDRLGINLFDADNKFIGMAGSAEQLRIALKKLNPQEQADAIGRLTTNASMPVFITLATAGEQGFRDIETLLDAQAKAADVAKDNTDSVTGDMKKFGAALEASAINIGEAAAPVLTTLAGGLEKVATGFNNAGGAAQLAMMAMAGYLAFGRQRMPRAVQGVQAGRMSFGLARSQTVAAIQAERQAAALRAMPTPLNNAAFLTRGFQTRHLDEQARAARQAALGYRTATGALGRWAGELRMLPTVGSKAIHVMGGMTSAVGAGAKGLMGALGGPWGLAITGVLSGLTLWQSHQESTARKLAESKARVDDNAAGLMQLATVYATTGKAGGDNVKKMLEANAPLRDLIQHTQDHGVSMEYVTKAAMGNARAQHEVSESYALRINRLQNLRDEIVKTTGADLDGKESLYDSGQRKRAPMTADQLARAKQEGVLRGKTDPTFAWWGGKSDTRNTLDEINRQLEMSEEEKKAWDKHYGDAKKIADVMERARKFDVNEAAKKFGVDLTAASEGVKAMTDNLVVMDAADSKFADRIQAMSANVDGLRATYLATADAAGQFYDVARSTKDAFTDEKGNRVGARIRTATGQFDVRDQRGAAQHAQTSGAVSAALELGKTANAQSAADLTSDYTKLGTAAIIAGSSVAQARKEFIKQNAPLVGGAKAAARLADSYGLVTRSFMSSIGGQGELPAVEQLDKLGVRMEKLTDASGQTKVVVTADTAPALREVVGLNAKITTDPITKEVSYTFKSAEELAAVLAGLNPPPVEVPVKPVLSGFEKGTLDYFGQPIKVPVQAEGGGQTVQVTPQLGPVPEVPDQQMQVTPQLGQVPEVPDQQMGVHPVLVGGIPQIPDQTVNVHVNRVETTTPAAPTPSRRWGGIHSFAAGGTIQAHVARGELIRYAEPETGGEAFIPRKGDAMRSRAILETAASWYGLGIHKMAAGGITSFAGGGLAGFTAPLGDFLSRYMSPANNWGTQRTDAIVAQRDAILDVKEAEKALADTRKDKKHTALELRRAENALADARRNLALANTALAKAKMAPRDQFKASLDSGVKSTATFIGNLNALANRGYGALAMQLLQMGGPEAEAIAGSARGWSASVLGRMNSQVQTAQSQQKTLANMPAMLAIRDAIKTGKSYSSLLGSGDFTGDELNNAIRAMGPELSKTAAGQAFLAALRGSTDAALNRSIRGYATGGIAPPGTMYRFAEPSTGGEAVIPRFGSGAEALIKTAAAWHGMTVGSAAPWEYKSQAARPVQVQITVAGEGVLANMIEAKVDGSLARVARASTRGRRSSRG